MIKKRYSLTKIFIRTNLKKINRRTKKHPKNSIRLTDKYINWDTALVADTELVRPEEEGRKDLWWCKKGRIKT